MAADLQSLLDAGVPVRTLVEHGSRALDWLLLQDDRKLRVCWRNESGEMQVAQVDRPGLLKLGTALKWKPYPAGEDGRGSDEIAFYDAVNYRDTNGCLWWTAEFDDLTGAPLCFPEAKLERLRDNAKRRMASVQRRLEAAKKRRVAGARGCARFAEGG